MNPVRKKRLFGILFFLSGVGLVVCFLLFALRENLDHFYTPNEISQGQAEGVKSLRVGGMVREGSLVRSTDSLKITFNVTDFIADVVVSYEGILPDLFREGQGVVVIGGLNAKGELEAKQVLAKHDEKYMPPEVKKALEKSGHSDKIEGL